MGRKHFVEFFDKGQDLALVYFPVNSRMPLATELTPEDSRPLDPEQESRHGQLFGISDIASRQMNARVCTSIGVW